MTDRMLATWFYTSIGSYVFLALVQAHLMISGLDNPLLYVVLGMASGLKLGLALGMRSIIQDRNRKGLR